MMEMDKFQLYFQPKVNVKDNHIISYEILLRNKETFPYYPSSDMDEIIGNQEKHALFLSWFESQLINQLNLFPTLIYSINFTPKQLLYSETHTFLTNIITFKERVMIELTEDKIAYFCPIKYLNIEMIDQEIISSLSLVKEKGYNISLDDVGSGGNSLEKVENYLPYIDQIKFSLIKYNSRLIEDETIQLFLKGWNSLAQKNKIELVVEGIENQETMNFLLSNNIYLQQGYFFGKPSKYIYKNNEFK